VAKALKKLHMTMIRMPEEHYRELQQLAATLYTSVAHVLREGGRMMLEKHGVAIEEEEATGDPDQ